MRSDRELIARLRCGADQLGRYDPPGMRNPLAKLLDEAAAALEAQSQDAARVPMTDEQINSMRKAPDLDPDDWPEAWSYRQGVKDAERAHGIAPPAASKSEGGEG